MRMLLFVEIQHDTSTSFLLPCDLPTKVAILKGECRYFLPGAILDTFLTDTETLRQSNPASRIIAQLKQNFVERLISNAK